MMKKLLLVWIVFVGVNARAQQFTLRNYTVKDGLPQSQVNVMVEDANGYLWLGTHGGGLARFDGTEFKVFTTRDGLLSNIINFLKIDSHGHMWIAHPRGISRFDGKSFKAFSQAARESSVVRIRRIFEYNDTIFFNTSAGTLGKIHNDSLHYWSKPIGENLNVLYFHVMDTNRVLFYTQAKTFEVWQNGHTHSFTHTSQFESVKRIFHYQGKSVVSTSQGYFEFDRQRHNWTPIDIPIENSIVAYDTTRNIFWTRWENFVLREEVRQGRHQIDTVLREVELTQVLIDAEDNTWFATSGNGIYRYFIQDFDRCSSERLRGIMAIHVDKKGNSWIGSTQRGLWKMSKGKVTSYTDDREPYHNYIYNIDESPAGDIWVATGYGLGKYLPENDSFKWFSRSDGLSTNSILSLEFDEAGNLWVGTLGGGLNHYDGKNFSRITSEKAMQGTQITALHYSHYHHRLYVGHEFGISARSRSEIADLPIKSIVNSSVMSIAAYRDSLLVIGTGGSGIAILDPASMRSWSYSTHDGLASDFVYFVATDEDQHIWIGSEKGITRIRLNAAFEVVENLHYDFNNGLTGVEANHNAYYLKGEVKYFGLVDGLYQFNEISTSSQVPFGVHLTGVEIFYGQEPASQYASESAGLFKLPVNPILPFDKNHITFHFNRVDKRYSRSTRFRYYLENFDRGWSPPGKTKEVTYSNLPPGNYVFRVMSTDHEGSWSAQQVAYSFMIKAPFYQTRAFVVSVVVLGIGLLVLVVIFRVRAKVSKALEAERIRAQGQDALRKEIARDFHDEMGNQLTRIINYVSLMKMNNGSAKGDLYTKVEESAKYLYTGTRDFIWAIDPVNDELGKLFIHIRDFGEKLFEEKSINFRAYNEVKRKVKLPFRFSREANLIFKEVMTNAFKHSGAKNVKLVLEQHNETYVMTFEDDGTGFNPAEIEKSNGLKNMRERADRTDAILRVSSSKVAGTRIALEFKLKTIKAHGTTL